jgi:peptidoglycan/xylan/chitin deacetylase (PgdA/CDA1 family)
MVWFLVVGFVVVALAHTAPFPFVLERFAPAHALWRMARQPESPTVYITYDDGPNPTATPELLDVLRDAGAHATFFVIDAHLTEATAPIVRRTFDEGHAVALHSDTRALMLQTPESLAEALTRNADRIERLTGRRPCRLFRPHAGWRSGAMYEGLRRIDHRLVGWSWGLWDWNWYQRRDGAALARRLVKRASDGDIVVMHDGHHVDSTADRRDVVDATRQLIPVLQARGFGFRRICDP